MTCSSARHTSHRYPQPNGADNKFKNHWDIPDQLCVSKDGVVRVCGLGFYIGLRFKNRRLYSTVTADNVAKFYTSHDGEFLFSVPLLIRLSHRLPGGQINITSLNE